MKSKPKKQVTLSRPKDQSLDAYKAWITELARRLTIGKTDITFTEAEWMESWNEYWKEQSGG